MTLESAVPMNGIDSPPKGLSMLFGASKARMRARR